MSKKDARFMRLAYNIGLKSSINIRHGCVAVLNGKVIAKGFNHERCFSSDGFIQETWCCHAEIDALRKLCYSMLGASGRSGVFLSSSSSLGEKKVAKLLSRVTLYVARVPGTGTDDDNPPSSSGSDAVSKSSAPCTSCMQTLRALGIKHVAFISKSSEFVKCRPREYDDADLHMTAGRRSWIKKYGLPSIPDISYVKICKSV